MDTSKRHFCTAVALALAALGIGAGAGAGERVLRIEARKFAYTPNRIELKRGEALVLEFMAVDFTHGFHIPDMKIRADLVAGKVTRVRLAPEAAGQFAFMCDNFCGSGHEDMNGTIIVRDALLPRAGEGS